MSDESVLQTVDIKALITAARRIYLDVAVNEILYELKKFKSCYSCWIPFKVQSLDCSMVSRGKKNISEHNIRSKGLIEYNLPHPNLNPRVMSWSTTAPCRSADSLFLTVAV